MSGRQWGVGEVGVRLYEEVGVWSSLGSVWDASHEKASFSTDVYDVE